MSRPKPPRRLLRPLRRLSPGLDLHAFFSLSLALGHDRTPWRKALGPSRATAEQVATITFMSFHVSEGGLEGLLPSPRRRHRRSRAVATSGVTSTVRSLLTRDSRPPAPKLFVLTRSMRWWCTRSKAVVAAVTHAFPMVCDRRSAGTLCRRCRAHLRGPAKSSTGLTFAAGGPWVASPQSG